MLARLRLPSPAIVVALVAVVLAAGGIAAASSSSTKVRKATFTVHYKSPCPPGYVAGYYNCSAPPVTKTVHCKSGEHATGGGYGQTNDGTGSGFAAFRPAPASGTPTGWTFSTQALTASSTSTSHADTKLPVYVVCESG
ncbi:MAG: hypothetical protein JOZ25_09255 [Actinobacteria bacterium]|nr:hypothetical protein [Actinomycetota bacterium]